MGKGYVLNLGATESIVVDPVEAEKKIVEKLIEKYKRNQIQWLHCLENDELEDAKTFQQSFSRLIDNILQKQKTGEKESIQFIMIFFLRSSLLDNSYKIRMEAFSKEGYFDSVEVAENWIPKLVVEYYLNACMELDKYVKSENIILPKEKMKSYLRKHYIDYMLLLPPFFEKQIKMLYEKGVFEDMKLENNFAVLFSEYMGGITPVFEINNKDMSV